MLKTVGIKESIALSERIAVLKLDSSEITKFSTKDKNQKDCESAKIPKKIKVFLKKIRISFLE